jgi:hypothetical protein
VAIPRLLLADFPAKWIPGENGEFYLIFLHAYSIGLFLDDLQGRGLNVPAETRLDITASKAW